MSNNPQINRSNYFIYCDKYVIHPVIIFLRFTHIKIIFFSWDMKRDKYIFHVHFKKCVSNCNNPDFLPKNIATEELLFFSTFEVFMQGNICECSCVQAVDIWPNFNHSLHFSEIKWKNHLYMYLHFSPPNWIIVSKLLSIYCHNSGHYPSSCLFL
jgi:hypothetical protein